MVGTTGLKQIRIECIVGVYPHERDHPQPIELDLELDYDFEAAAASDAIDDAVDYAGIIDDVTALIQREKFQLIETMAERATRLLLAEHAAVRSVRLEIRKPNALPAAACSFVRVVRTRP